jgi:hypothetical protein
MATSAFPELAVLFATTPVFTSSPLSEALCRVASGSDEVLSIAAQGQPGVQPTFLLLAAVQYLLVREAAHALADYYPSLRGDAALPPSEAGRAFLAFCKENDDELRGLVATRTVQTNSVTRTMALRLALHRLGTLVSEPVHVVEVGASAGLNLGFQRYGYHLGDRRSGDLTSPVQISTDWLGSGPPPDLDDHAAVATVRGLDLRPVDVTDPDQRAWLEALVWPENSHHLNRLRAALDVAVEHPPQMIAGDIIDLSSHLDSELPPGEPRLVWHIATRVHVPPERFEAFDAAIDTLGTSAPLYTLSSDLGGLALRGPHGDVTQLGYIDGHLDWIRPL